MVGFAQMTTVAMGNSRERTIRLLMAMVSTFHWSKFLMAVTKCFGYTRKYQTAAGTNVGNKATESRRVYLGMSFEVCFLLQFLLRLLFQPKDVPC